MESIWTNQASDNLSAGISVGPYARLIIDVGLDADGASANGKNFGGGSVELVRAWEDAAGVVQSSYGCVAKITDVDSLEILTNANRINCKLRLQDSSGANLSAQYRIEPRAMSK